MTKKIDELKDPPAKDDLDKQIEVLENLVSRGERIKKIISDGVRRMQDENK